MPLTSSDATKALAISEEIMGDLPQISAAVSEGRLTREELEVIFVSIQKALYGLDECRARIDDELARSAK